MIKRSAGILMHITSLASPYGIGTLGKAAYEFIDFLHASEMRYWQILPICPPSVGNSPYSAYSSFAGNPLFIDLDLLVEDGYLSLDEIQAISWGINDERVDFDIINQERKKLFKMAYNRFKADSNFEIFIKDNDFWLKDYAIFMTLIELNDNKPWNKWPDDLKDINSLAVKKIVEDHQNIYRYHLVLQYWFYEQWDKLKKYANSKDVLIIGDLPIYVGYNSSDVYGNRKLFCLDEKGEPQDVSGCPPDAYAKDGQKWGNPLYDWDYHIKDDYHWWITRISHHLKLHDALRIDHFRGFEAFFAIPLNENASKGVWKKGPGYDFFIKLHEKLGDVNLIAEDLGFITDSLKELLTKCAYPGMKVLQFAFEANAPASDYLPHRYNENCIAYTGTHDNDTLIGWIKNAPADDIRYALDYSGAEDIDKLPLQLIKALWMSKANLVMIQAQDLLSLDSDARMNIPSIPDGNWSWRSKPHVFSEDLARYLAGQVRMYGRKYEK